MRNFFQIATLVLMGAMLFSIAPASAAIVIPHHPAAIDGPDSCTAICGAPAIATTTDTFTPIRVAFDPCMPRVRGPIAVADALATIAPVKRDSNVGVAVETTDQAHAGRRVAVVCGGKSALADCSAQLGHLPDVSEREVRSVDNRDRIKLIPLCDRLDASLTQAQQNLAQHGNAETLVPAIAQNVALTTALGHGRYRADDVVGIVMGTDTVMLYVHKM